MTEPDYGTLALEQFEAWNDLALMASPFMNRIEYPEPAAWQLDDPEMFFDNQFPHLLYKCAVLRGAQAPVMDWWGRPRARTVP